MKRGIDSFARTSMRVLQEQEDFWYGSLQTGLPELLRYSFALGFFPFAGYLFSYTVRGTIWNVWPFVQTTLDVGSGLVFAGMQWILFGIFPVLSSLVLEIVLARTRQPVDFEQLLTISTYSMTPLSLAGLFAGVPFLDRICATLGFATFLFLIYYGFRYALNFTIMRSAFRTFLFLVLFALIRQMFVFAIGY
ncbi:YIP1 family protein [bacterium]|nr:YIP1 family protein [bacterium]MCI0603828.1 YIP1 family protein [bacterium]